MAEQQVQTNPDQGDTKDETYEDFEFAESRIGANAPDVSSVGNISVGLVWSFYYGYLNLVLSKLLEKIDEWMSRNPSKSDTMSKRLYLLLPVDTSIFSSVSDADKSIEFVETLTTEIIDRAGVVRRTYKNTIYKFRKDDKEYHVVTEFATPLETMAKIKDGKIAGLTEEAFKKEVQLFKEKLSEILEFKNISHKCSLVIYDKEQSLPDVLAEEIGKVLKGGEPPGFPAESLPHPTQELSQDSSVSKRNLVPVGDISPGLAWSFYYGYLALILPEISNKINEWVEANSPKYRIIPRRLYILLPTNAKCPNSLTEKDDSIAPVDTITTLETDRAGNKGRKYRNTVYGISKPDKEYYIVTEYATPLRVMAEMESGGLAGLTESALKIQVNLFKDELAEILSHKDVPHDCCTLVICDDSRPLSDLLVEEIDKETKRVKEELGGITEEAAASWKCSLG